jgi:acyl carrier protein
MPLSREDLLRYLSEDLRVDTASLDADTPLFSSGVIDSFALVSLLLHIEKSCAIQIGPGDVNLDNFDSLDRILAYLAARVGAGAAG